MINSNIMFCLGFLRKIGSTDYNLYSLTDFPISTPRPQGDYITIHRLKRSGQEFVLYKFLLNQDSLPYIGLYTAEKVILLALNSHRRSHINEKG